MPTNRIVIGSAAFTEQKITSGSVYLSSSIAFDELGIDTLSSTVDCSGAQGTLFLPRGASGLLTSEQKLFHVHPVFTVLTVDPSGFAYGQRVEYYRDAALFAAFYLTGVRRVGRYLYTLTCVSAIGLMDAMPHYGGLYTGQTASAVLASLIPADIPYTVSPEAARLRVYGWLPVSTRRDNLRQLLFALGVAVEKDASGNMRFALLSVSTPAQLPDSRILMGGSVDYPAAASRAVVVEHSYMQAAGVPEETLYDGAVTGEAIRTPGGKSVTGAIVTFDGPMHSLSVTGAVILESDVNYAVLSPSGGAVLTGRGYAHTTREVVKDVAGAGGAENVARVESATLVNATNSNGVARRVADYYSAARTVTTGLLVGAERPGDAVRFRDPFDEMTTALLSSLELNISSTLTAQATLLAGYTPRNDGSYTRVAVLTGSGSWTAPAGVTSILAVLIGGGTGGWSGLPGGSPPDQTVSTTSDGFWLFRRTTAAAEEGGPGGAPGQGGLGGRLLQANLDVTPGQSISYRCGTGGAGGIHGADTAPGAEGTATTFGSLSSAAGTATENGFLDPINGDVYGAAGAAGVAGGRGSGAVRDENGNAAALEPGPDITYLGVTYHAGAIQELGGEDSAGSSQHGTLAAAWATGNGGGAAAGGSGANGLSDGRCSASWSGSGRGMAKGGTGGSGAAAVKPGAQTRPGFGGVGGNGGGGAGAPGEAIVSLSWNSDQQAGSPAMNVTAAQSGAPGPGSDGGTGGPGVILIYY